MGCESMHGPYSRSWLAFQSACARRRGRRIHNCSTATLTASHPGRAWLKCPRLCIITATVLVEPLPRTTGLLSSP